MEGKSNVANGLVIERMLAHCAVRYVPRPILVAELKIHRMADQELIDMTQPVRPVT